MKIFTSALLPKTKKTIGLFQQKKPLFLKQFYLSGGTALALQLGHRQSEDLDFFSSSKFSPSILQQQLSKLGKIEDMIKEKDTLNLFFNGVQIQFLLYPYPLLKIPHSWKGIKISSLIDIACTKIDTISSRGSKKDFFDLYFLLEKFSLSQILKNFQKKYKGIDYNLVHILKSLVYFVDAESQPLPRLFQEVSWREVKKKIQQEVSLLSQTQITQKRQNQLH
jgi:predicted nucleotidyltransferase component of viral defense system